MGQVEQEGMGWDGVVWRGGGAAVGRRRACGLRWGVGAPVHWCVRGAMVVTFCCITHSLMIAGRTAIVEKRAWVVSSHVGPPATKQPHQIPLLAGPWPPPPCWRQRIEWDGGRFSYSCAWLLLLSYRAGLRRTPPPVLPLADRGGYGKAKDLIMVLRLESSEWKHALKVSAGEKPWDQSSTHASKH